jgi:hypothetical protein
VIDGNYITRDELAAHIKGIDVSLRNLDRRVEKIELSVGSGDRWISARITSIIDKALPLLLIAAATYLLTH